MVSCWAGESASALPIGRLVWTPRRRYDLALIEHSFHSVVVGGGDGMDGLEYRFHTGLYRSTNAMLLGKNGVNGLCLDDAIAMPLALSAIRDRQ
jgi:hypothetical protein